MVKHILLTGATVVAVAGLTGAAVRHYDQYKNTQPPVKTTAQQVNAAVAGVQKSWSAKYNDLAGELSTVQDQCAKGMQAYAQLTPAQKAKLPAFTCKP